MAPLAPPPLDPLLIIALYFQTFVENASEAMKAQKQREKGQDVNNNNKRVYLRDPSPSNQSVT